MTLIIKKPLNILLINPEDIGKHKRVSELNPFAGLAYIATFVENAFGGDVSVEVIEMLPQRMTAGDVLKKVDESKIDICGITSKTYNFQYAQGLASAIKETSPETLIVFGGAHATALPEEVVKNNSIDAIIPREGEVVFKDIVQNLLSGSHTFDGVKGVVFKSGGEIINNGHAELIKDLDKIPFPNWDKYYDLDAYDRYYNNRTEKFCLMLPIFASRGCPYGCHFCQPLLTRQYRMRSVINVIDEVEYLADRYKIERIYFEDSIFGLKKDWFLDYCHQYMARGMHKIVKWGFETNVNCVDPERMESAREAGCEYVYFGMESASDKVLKHLGKGATKEKNLNAIEISKKAGIYEVSGSFIFGMPYETSETANETLNFIKESKLNSININLLDVYPGTELYSMVEKGAGGIRWIPEKRNKWDECGRTLVKTYVNDMDTVEKLEDLYVRALQILHEKYRKNYWSYVKKVMKYFIYYSIHNPGRLKIAFKRTLLSYFPRLFRLS